MIIEYIILILISYLIGSIPFAYIIVKAVKGIDIRSVGSGNVGATNVARVLGKWGFISVLILDMLKGFIPVIIAYIYYGQENIVLYMMIAVVLGHTFTIFLSFKGGKGVATGAGAFFALVPFSMLVAVVVFLLTFAITRMVSASSIMGAISLLISVLLMESWLPLIVITCIVVLFVIYKHKSNIVRIIKGQESRFERKKKDTTIS